VLGAVELILRARRVAENAKSRCVVECAFPSTTVGVKPERRRPFACHAQMLPSVSATTTSFCPSPSRSATIGAPNEIALPGGRIPSVRAVRDFAGHHDASIARTGQPGMSRPRESRVDLARVGRDDQLSPGRPSRSANTGCAVDALSSDAGTRREIRIVVNEHLLL
jgi:hypothetical protein